MKLIHVFSGGMDSTVLLAKWLHEKCDVTCLHFQYGSKHNPKELLAANTITEHYNVPLTIIDVSTVLKHFKSALLSGGEAIPEGHYADDNMKKTVVPFRNGIMLAIAAGFAESNDAEAISLASHAGDHTIYPDCRPAFNTAMEDAIREGTWARVRMLAPFYNMSKTDIATLGYRLKVPFELTWTCYKGGRKHCGVCGACSERKEAFHDSGTPDPTEYEV